MRQLQVKFAYSDPTLLPGFTYVGRIYIAIALQTNASHIVDLREIDISLTTLVGDPDYTMSFLYMESVTGAVDSTFQQMLFGGPVLGLPANYGYQDRANAVLTSSGK